MSFVIPLFHLRGVMYLSVKMLDMVELWVELWWNFT